MSKLLLKQETRLVKRERSCCRPAGTTSESRLTDVWAFLVTLAAPPPLAAGTFSANPQGTQQHTQHTQAHVLNS
ncbi:hypothetical protein DAPPUDRAFT_264335 [Daphnia pulex]|uniref:Uncharacterized protein n=1 Tax=Daphnia pulex TaxID=6669 RepID=E9HRD5_DAPPU|nr:hypothetical protein DAPPUDRAFT_264335 [Daphnia pulex]|eukprot:EFX65683.1 hypothetical protein DAPPUDRAFT_264335 [Daphnia pulex]